MNMNRATVLLILIALVASATAFGSSNYRKTSLTTYSLTVAPGWNLLSLPGSVTDGRRAVLFPSAISSAYIFSSSSGYQPRDTLQNGIGFWLKFNGPDTILITCDAVAGDTIEVQAGWNIIGAISSPVNIESIITNPPGIVASDFFEYVPGAGYQQADTLYPGVGYWVKASQSGTAVLRSPGGLPCPGIPTVEYAGKTYHTVQIGSQCWLRENLDAGTMIPGSQNQSDNGTTEKYCYDNILAYCDTFGGLYQWDEAMQYDTTVGAQGVCPPGWHLPTLAEFQALGDTVGGDGNALKAIGQGTGVGAGTNASGFSALLAGYRTNLAVFGYLGSRGRFWSSTQEGTDYRGNLGLLNDDASVNLYTSTPITGFSVRCLKNETPNSPPDAPSYLYPDSLESNVWTSPTLMWSCSDPDGDPLTYDVYFGTLSPPDTLISSSQSDTTLARTALVSATNYYWKVVAKDNHGHATSGPVWSFTTQSGGGSPCSGVPTVLFEGKTYHTVQIGSQCWLRENLDVGTMVPGTAGQYNNGIVEKYCYNDSAVNCDLYGGLYQWNEVMQYSSTPGAQGICPPGWHIATTEEFGTLRLGVGSNGNALKEIGQGSGSGTGTNTSGFSAILAGNRLTAGNFNGLGSQGQIWSSTHGNQYLAFAMYLYGSYANIDLYEGNEFFGNSVRCLKN